ncbi:hypothetical protein P615_08645 [Brevibacillus laterosporus PE36]|nr:hypothetical protein P615_08645 [Brevibacillus laterosporus PE36]
MKYQQGPLSAVDSRRRAFSQLLEGLGLAVLLNLPNDRGITTMFNILNNSTIRMLDSHAFSCRHLFRLWNKWKTVFFNIGANSSRKSSTKVAIVALKGARDFPIRKVIKSSLLKQFPNSFRDI